MRARVDHVQQKGESIVETLQSRGRTEGTTTAHGYFLHYVVFDKNKIKKPLQAPEPASGSFQRKDGSGGDWYKMGFSILLDTIDTATGFVALKDQENAYAVEAEVSYSKQDSNRKDQLNARHILETLCPLVYTHPEEWLQLLDQYHDELPVPLEELPNLMKKLLYGNTRDQDLMWIQNLVENEELALPEGGNSMSPYLESLLSGNDGVLPGRAFFAAVFWPPGKPETYWMETIKQWLYPETSVSPHLTDQVRMLISPEGILHSRIPTTIHGKSAIQGSLMEFDKSAFRIFSGGSIEEMTKLRLDQFKVTAYVKAYSYRPMVYDSEKKKRIPDPNATPETRFDIRYGFDCKRVTLEKAEFADATPSEVFHAGFDKGKCAFVPLLHVLSKREPFPGGITYEWVAGAQYVAPGNVKQTLLVPSKSPEDFRYVKKATKDGETDEVFINMGWNMVQSAVFAPTGAPYSYQVGATARSDTCMRIGIDPDMWTAIMYAHQFVHSHLLMEPWEKQTMEALGNDPVSLASADPTTGGTYKCGVSVWCPDWHSYCISPATGGGGNAIEITAELLLKLFSDYNLALPSAQRKFTVNLEEELGGGQRKKYQFVDCFPGGSPLGPEKRVINFGCPARPMYGTPDATSLLFETPGIRFFALTEIPPSAIMEGTTLEQLLERNPTLRYQILGLLCRPTNPESAEKKTKPDVQ